MLNHLIPRLLMLYLPWLLLLHVRTGAWARRIVVGVSHPRRRLNSFRLVLLNHMRSKRVTSLKYLRTLDTLMDNTGDVSLNMLFDSKLKLVWIVALSTRPGSFDLNWIVVWHQQKPDLSLQLFVMRTSLSWPSWWLHDGFSHLLELYLHHIVWSWTHLWARVVIIVILLLVILLLLLLLLGLWLRGGVRTHNMRSQRVPGLAGFLTLGTLMDEPRYVSFDVLLDSVSGLGGEMTLSTLPDRLADDWVVWGDQELGHLSVQLVGVLSILLSRGELLLWDGQFGGAGNIPGLKLIWKVNQTRDRVWVRIRSFSSNLDLSSCGAVSTFRV